MRAQTRPAWRRYAALSAAAAGLTACAVANIEVDVYKGPLANDRRVQAEQMAVMAISAKPLLIRLRDRYGNGSGNGLSSQNRNRFICGDAFSRNAGNAAEFINGVLSLYEDKADIERRCAVGRGLAQEVENYERARALLRLYRNSWEGYLSRVEGFDRIFADLYADIAQGAMIVTENGPRLVIEDAENKARLDKIIEEAKKLAESYRKFLGGEAEFVRDKVKTIFVLHQNLQLLGAGFESNLNEIGLRIDYSNVKERNENLSKPGEYNAFEGAKNRRSEKGGLEKAIDNPQIALSLEILAKRRDIVESHASFLFPRDSAGRALFVAAVQEKAEQYRAARQATHDLLRLNLERLLFINRHIAERAGAVSQDLVVARREMIEFTTRLIDRSKLVAAIVVINGEISAEGTDDTKSSKLNISRGQLRDLRVKYRHFIDKGLALYNQSDGFREQPIEKYLAFLNDLLSVSGASSDAARALLLADQIFSFKGLPVEVLSREDDEKKDLAKNAGAAERWYGLSRIDEGTSVEELSGFFVGSNWAQAASGLERGRLPLGLETLIELYLESDFQDTRFVPTDKECGGKGNPCQSVAADVCRHGDEECKRRNACPATDAECIKLRREQRLFRLTNALVRFAQKVLFVTNNDSLFRDGDGGAGAGEDTQAYRDVLQSIGNSILVAADELHVRDGHDAKLGEFAADNEVAGIKATVARNGATYFSERLGDFLSGLRKAKADLEKAEAAGEKAKADFGKALSAYNEALGKEDLTDETTLDGAGPDGEGPHPFVPVGPGNGTPGNGTPGNGNPDNGDGPHTGGAAASLAKAKSAAGSLTKAKEDAQKDYRSAVKEHLPLFNAYAISQKIESPLFNEEYRKGDVDGGILEESVRRAIDPKITEWNKLRRIAGTAIVAKDLARQVKAKSETAVGKFKGFSTSAKEAKSQSMTLKLLVEKAAEFMTVWELVKTAKVTIDSSPLWPDKPTPNTPEIEAASLAALKELANKPDDQDGRNAARERLSILSKKLSKIINTIKGKEATLNKAKQTLEQARKAATEPGFSGTSISMKIESAIPKAELFRSEMAQAAKDWESVKKTVQAFMETLSDSNLVLTSSLIKSARSKIEKEIGTARRVYNEAIESISASFGPIEEAVEFAERSANENITLARQMAGEAEASSDSASRDAERALSWTEEARKSSVKAEAAASNVLNGSDELIGNTRDAKTKLSASVQGAKDAVIRAGKAKTAATELIKSLPEEVADLLTKSGSNITVSKVESLSFPNLLSAYVRNSADAEKASTSALAEAKTVERSALKAFRSAEAMARSRIDDADAKKISAAGIAAAYAKAIDKYIAGTLIPAGVRESSARVMALRSASKWFGGDELAAEEFPLDEGSAVSANRLFDLFRTTVGAKYLKASGSATIALAERKVAESEEALGAELKRLNRLRKDAVALKKERDAVAAEIERLKTEVDKFDGLVTVLRDLRSNELAHIEDLDGGQVFALIRAVIEKRAKDAGDAEPDSKMKLLAALEKFNQFNPPLAKPATRDEQDKNTFTRGPQDFSRGRRATKRENAKDVLDRVVAMLRQEHIQAVRQFGETDPRTVNLLASMEAAYQHRAGMAYLRPAAAYLRTVFTATSLQDNASLGWRNRLREHALRSAPLANLFIEYGDDDREKLISDIDKQNWQNINRVRVAGAGETNYVMVKDDIGNWYVKGFSTNVDSIVQSATNLAKFTLGGSLGADLVNRPAPGEAGPVPGTQQTQLEQAFDGYESDFEGDTNRQFDAASRLIADTGLPEEVGAALALIEGLTDEDRAALRAAVDTAKARLEPGRTALAGSSDAERGANIVVALRAARSFHSALQVGISNNSLTGAERRTYEEKQEELEKQQNQLQRHRNEAVRLRNDVAIKRLRSERYETERDNVKLERDRLQDRLDKLNEEADKDKPKSQKVVDAERALETAEERLRKAQDRFETERGEFEEAQEKLSQTEKLIADGDATIERLKSEEAAALRALHAKQAVVARVKREASAVVLDALERAVADREKSVNSFEYALNGLGRVTRPATITTAPPATATNPGDTPPATPAQNGN